MWFLVRYIWLFIYWCDIWWHNRHLTRHRPIFSWFINKLNERYVDYSHNVNVGTALHIATEKNAILHTLWNEYKGSSSYWHDMAWIPHCYIIDIIFHCTLEPKLEWRFIELQTKTVWEQLAEMLTVIMVVNIQCLGNTWEWVARIHDRYK